MGLVKRTYVDGETVITAENLNDIQDAIIQNEEDIATKGTYSKPSGGIPKTDLASAVQTSLGKADTALQSSDIDSTLTVTGKAADAKKTGDEISGIKNTLTQLGNSMQKVVPVLTGATNDLGYTLTVGNYFEYNGVMYKVTTAIPNTEAWAGKATLLSAAVINDLATASKAIESGLESTGQTVGVGSVAFTNPHSTAPNGVAATCVTNGQTYIRYCYIYSVSATGFSFAIRNDENSFANGSIYWVAVWN